MNLSGVNHIIRFIVVGASKNSTLILTGLSVGGVGLTTGLAIKATPKALWLLEKAGHSRRRARGFRPWLKSTAEVVKLTWKCYIPTVAMGVATILCIIGNNKINLSRTAALASVLSITKAKAKEYEAKVIETIGEAKEQRIHDDIAQDHLDAKPLVPSQVIITGGGDMLCFDTLSGQYFTSDIEKIRRIENKINHGMMGSMFMFASVNELNSELGIEPVLLGDEMGWNVDNLLQFTFSSKLAKEGKPCLVIGYVTVPIKGFNEVY